MIVMKTMIIRIIIFINITGIMLIFDICIFILRRWKKSKNIFVYYFLISSAFVAPANNFICISYNKRDRERDIYIYIDR